MSYISFQKEEITNLGNSLQKEFVKSNQSGSYAATTITWCNTRKYHGLFVSPVEGPRTDNYVFLSSIDETIVQHEAEFNLGLHQFPNEFHPLGHKYIEKFNNDPIPCTVYRVGGVVLTKELLMPNNGNNVLIRYTLNEAASKTTLKLRPFTPFRKTHQLTRANLTANTRSQTIENGIQIKLYEALPSLFLQLNKSAEYIHAPDWFYNVEYQKERDRGLEFTEDLFTPGFFEVPIKKGESIIVSASLNIEKPASLKRTFSSQEKKSEPINDYLSCLKHSGKEFIADTDAGKEIIASFPWPGKWGRDGLISAPALSSTENGAKTYKAILDTFSKEIDGIIYDNIGNIEKSHIASIDTSLWYIWAIQQFAYSTDGFKQAVKYYGKKIIEIIDTFRDNNDGDISLHENGLLYIKNPDKILTWMDSSLDGHPVVRRWGFVVEINALWYNALMFANELADKGGLKKCSIYKDTAKSIKQNFKSIFWNEEGGYLFDFVTEDQKDSSVRPNQIFAAALPFSPLKADEQRKLLDVVQSELLTPRGIRSLSPKNTNYKGSCSGTFLERQIAYHQGTVWPWLLSFYAEAHLKINGKSGIGAIRRIYEEQEQELKDHGLGTIAEVYDGDPPYSPRGAISQAWSIAALLRISYLIDQTEKL